LYKNVFFGTKIGLLILLNIIISLFKLCKS